jgi:hypothetical protein
VIHEWPAYVMYADLAVWRMPGRVRCKGGGTRQQPAKKLKPSRDGRVSLSRDGKTARFHVYRQLFRATFPELFERPQALCHNGHPLLKPVNPDLFGSVAPLMAPRVARWGTGNRICLQCWRLPEEFDTHTYSLQYGPAGVPEYSGLPAQPKLSGRRIGDGDLYQLAELEWGEHGYVISNSL